MGAGLVMAIPRAEAPETDVAWDALIAQHQHRVLLTLLARGVRLDRARDLTQETWARLIQQHRDGKLTRIELPGLAIRQALFLASDDARRKRREHGDDELGELVDPAPSALARLVTRAQLERASAELATCSPKAQEVFELVYDDDGVSHAEAARRVGLSVQRVRQTICEVRAKLRAALHDGGFDD